jgi:hypothetical protein
MANKYALAPFTVTLGGASHFVDVGGMRDSASAVVAAAPSMFTTLMTIGATTVASVNPNPVPVNITVTGGTVTVIAVGGVVTGLTTGTFLIPPAGSITITYSVGPTFTQADVAPAALPTVTGVLAQYLANTIAGP